MGVIGLLIILLYIYVSFWAISIFFDMDMYEMLTDTTKEYTNACEAKRQGINEGDNSFADAIFWSDLGNH